MYMFADKDVCKYMGPYWLMTNRMYVYNKPTELEKNRWLCGGERLYVQEGRNTTLRIAAEKKSLVMLNAASIGLSKLSMMVFEYYLGTPSVTSWFAKARIVCNGVTHVSIVSQSAIVLQSLTGHALVLQRTENPKVHFVEECSYSRQCVDGSALFVGHDWIEIRSDFTCPSSARVRIDDRTQRGASTAASANVGVDRVAIHRKDVVNVYDLTTGMNVFGPVCSFNAQDGMNRFPGDVAFNDVSSNMVAANVSDQRAIRIYDTRLVLATQKLSLEVLSPKFVSFNETFLVYSQLDLRARMLCVRWLDIRNGQVVRHENVQSIEPVYSHLPMDRPMLMAFPDVLCVYKYIDKDNKTNHDHLYTGSGVQIRNEACVSENNAIKDTCVFF
jgi:hypothetical protein